MYQKPQSFSKPSSFENTDAHYAIDRLIRLMEVMKITGLKRSSLYAKMAARQFPRPVKIGLRASAWRLNEICQWNEAPMQYVDRGANE